jgi:hypothetical protein
MRRSAGESDAATTTPSSSWSNAIAPSLSARLVDLGDADGEGPSQAPPWLFERLSFDGRSILDGSTAFVNLCLDHRRGARAGCGVGSRPRRPLATTFSSSGRVKDDRLLREKQLMA